MLLYALAALCLVVLLMGVIALGVYLLVISYSLCARTQAARTTVRGGVDCTYSSSDDRCLHIARKSDSSAGGLRPLNSVSVSFVPSWKQ